LFQTKLVSVHLSERELSNRILAVTFSTTTEDLILNSVAGFICVTEINVKEQKLTVLSPQPKPLPKTLLLLSEVQFVDSS
jgi:polyribonucleotide 5'-hydroxyl-kinase